MHHACIYRPLLAFDKKDIVDIAEKIDTYETSIPYELLYYICGKTSSYKTWLKSIRISERRVEED